MNNKITTVNYHLLKGCNMRCKFCYATFQDTDNFQLPQGYLKKEESLELIKALSAEGFTKINFAGGEPTLYPWLPDLVIYAKSLGLKTSIVTNGTVILKDKDYLRKFKGNLDIVGLSIDSIIDETNLESGRAFKGKYAIAEEEYILIAERIKSENIQLKINTVVSNNNFQETMTSFINKLSPFRWKILQMLIVEGQNDSYGQAYSISNVLFQSYVRRNKIELTKSVKVIVEDNDMLTGSYIMINPNGCFFDNTLGRHTNSSKILAVGVIKALEEISMDYDKFIKREGIY